MIFYSFSAAKTVNTFIGVRRDKNTIHMSIEVTRRFQSVDRLAVSKALLKVKKEIFFREFRVFCQLLIMGRDGGRDRGRRMPATCQGGR